MNKILVEVYIPVAGKSYDVFVPTNILMNEVLKMIRKAINEMSDGLFAADDSTVICNREDGSILNINLSVCELGLKNGSKLILI